ncbi:hypothetical protein TVAG_096340 [Trichomonas vaginalis G3]|uniref:Uncharacterized protein n=1 Tax=Trichomonas vaginalis (strain ATCC PRA-98 / G3) TaxID=412133 RepID=A2FT28_TRIV3|nr:hypothetical protein TVAGG3_0815940 [Trichomonas vaginalis G3]EAX91937.1 hypothetical protein TVAG_096340 [Trichomonas vaginalis G3]KAI5497534.1 hypothetical protein TVAGG3_0815940 [Trichomonas vaginalis G3]|eukprot:XP_001304867.1 hypothetical protein [Trichomonas vaginalis G3]
MEVTDKNGSSKSNVSRRKTPKQRRSSFDIVALGADLFDNLASSSLASKSSGSLAQDIQAIAKYQKYIVTNSESVKFTSLNKATIDLVTHKSAINSMIVEYDEIRSNFISDLVEVKTFIDKHTDYYPYSLRRRLRRQIATRLTTIELLDVLIANYQQSGIEIDYFVEHLMSLPQPVYINVTDYIEDFDFSKQSKHDVDVALRYIGQLKFPDVTRIKKKSPFHLIDSFEGQIFRRIKENFRGLTADDSAFIIKNLSKNSTYNIAEEVFFQRAWLIKEFPWSLEPYLLPDMSRVLVKSFAPSFLSQKYLNMTFAEFSQDREGPYYGLIQDITGIIFEINPFNIARVLWKMMNDIPNVIREMNHITSKDFVVDFDQLFSTLIILVCATCIPVITKYIAFAAAYRAAAEYDPQLSYAMGHLEGLYYHLKNIKSKDLISHGATDVSPQKKKQQESEILKILFEETPV